MKRIIEDRPLTNAERHQRWIIKSDNKEKRREYLRKWNAANKERNYIRQSSPSYKATKKIYNQRPEVKDANRVRELNRLRNPAKRAGRLLASAKGRAKKFNIPFTIKTNDIENLLAKGKCPHTGMQFEFSGPLKGVRKNPWSPSLDQKDPRKGYTPDNIEIVSTWWNIAKNEWPPEVNQAAIKGLIKRYR